MQWITSKLTNIWHFFFDKIGPSWYSLFWVWQSIYYSSHWLRILSFDEIANLQNCPVVLNFFNKEVPEAFQELFKIITNQHYYNTRAAYRNKLSLRQVKTGHYGLQSLKYKSAKAWNEVQTKISDKFNIGYWSKNRLSKSF